MDLKLLAKKKAVISQWHMNYLLNELKIIFDSDFKFIGINNNTGVRIYSQWQVLVADFYYKNGDTIIVKLQGNWCSFYKNMLKSCILKTFKWDFVPENKCCFGFFSEKNQLEFLI